MTRVLFLSPGGELGGAERSLLDLIATLRVAKPGLHLGLISGSAGPLQEAARELDVDSCVVPFPAVLGRLGDSGAGGPAGDQRSVANLIAAMSAAVPAVARYIVSLRRDVTGFSPDVVHSNGLKMHVLAAWAGPLNVPIIWHVRDYVSKRPVMSHLMRLHAHRCAAAIAISRSVAADLISTCGERFPVFQLYNAIDTERFAPQGRRLDLDALAGLPPAAAGVVRIGLLATMARWKGHEVFLRALASLDQALSFRAYIIGGAVYQSQGSQYSVDDLRLIVKGMGLASRVGFTGFVDDPAAAIRALDIVVHASTEPEPFGRTIAEAMACGRPVVVSNAGGARELITDGVDALAYPPGAADAMARCIENLVADRDLRMRLGAAGRIKAKSRFDRSRLADETAPIYSMVLGENVAFAS